MTSASGPISVSVRDLVGNPDVALTNPRLWQRAHAAVQARLSRKYKSFRAEVVLSELVSSDALSIRVNGRLDGIRQSRATTTIYEIKSVPGRAIDWMGSPALARARRQLRLYADLLRASHASRAIRLVLILAGTDGSLREEEVTYDSTADLLRRRLVTFLREHTSRTQGWREQFRVFADQDTISDRPSQHDALMALANARDELRLLLVLPPGAGKTRIALRTALQSAVDNGTPVYWITSKSRGRDEVIAELERIRAAGVPLQYLWKTSAARLCPECADSGFCSHREATQELLFRDGSEQLGEITCNRITELAASGLCPYELTRLCERRVDVVIADLNYFLDSSTLNSRAVRVLDEAHNLAARIEDQWSVQISDSELRGILRSLPAGVRSKFLPLLQHSSIDEPAELAELWGELSVLLESSGLTSHAIRTLARGIAKWPGEYMVARGVESGSGFWIGYLPDPKPAAENLLESDSPLFLALSGSLPGGDAGKFLFPIKTAFNEIDVAPNLLAAVILVPLLDFKFPLNLSDHEQAADALRRIHEQGGGSILVFGQNRASNEIIANRLRASGFNSLLGEDLADDWTLAQDVRPDFVLTVLGANLSESVNPPESLFVAGVVLSPGFRPPTIFDKHRQAIQDALPLSESRTDSPFAANGDLAQAAARIIQAVGRLNRTPSSRNHVFLLNKSFTNEVWLKLWPSHWHLSTHEELSASTLENALLHVESVPANA